MDALFPPGPQKSLLLGDALQFRASPLETMIQAARRYGDVVHFRFGPSHAYLLTNPRDAHDVLVERFDQFADQHSLLRALNSAMGHDLFAPEDRAGGKKLRRGLFKPPWLDVFADDLPAFIDDALDSWQGGDPVAALQSLTLQWTARALFGDHEVSDLAHKLAQVISVTRADRVFQSPLTPPTWVPTARNRQQQRAAGVLNEVMAALVQSHRALHRYSVFSCLLQAADSEQRAVEEMLALFYAGHEAAANMVAWAWHLLSQSPDAADALQVEVDGVLGSRPPRAEDLPNLPYTDMIVNETLRLYPPVWLISRQAKRETRIGEYYLPSGSTVFISPYIIQRSPRYYPSPEHFIPERFGDGQVGRGFAYLPFAGGTYAESEFAFTLISARLILASVVQHFRVQAQAGHQVQHAPDVSPRPRGMQLELKRRLALASV